MQVSEKSEELYDELAKQIEANDDAAARGIFQELLNNGFSRQEIVVRVSRLIEISPRISISGAAGSGSALMDILHPFFEIAAVRGEVEADTEAGAAESDIY